MTQSEPSVRERIRNQLLNSGWEESDILNAPALVADETILRPDIVLVQELYPVALIETASLEDTDGAAARSTLLKSAAILGTQSAFIMDGIETRRVDLLTNSVLPVPTPTPSSVIDIPFTERKLDPRFAKGFDMPKMLPRPYQVQAISRTIDAFLEGRRQVLLQMDQGSGLTFVALQTAGKVVHSGYKKRILYVADSQRTIENIKKLSSSLEEGITVRSSAEVLQINKENQQERLVFDPIIGANGQNNSGSISEFDMIFFHDIARMSITVLEYLTTTYPDAVIFAVTGTSKLPTWVLQKFGIPVFRYSLEERLDTEEIQPPQGYRAVRLGDIAEIQSGISAASALRDKEVLTTPINILTGRSISSDGAIDFQHIRSIDVPSRDISSANEARLRRWQIRPQDILMPRVTHSPRFAFVQNVPEDLFISDALLRIRVDPVRAKPEEVFLFLRSHDGYKALQRSASTLSSDLRFFSRDLAHVVIFLPEAQVVEEEAVQELGIIGSTLREVRDILQVLEQADPKTDEEVVLPTIAAKLRKLASAIVPPSLSTTVIQDYPTPIALAFRRYDDARFNPYEQVLRLRDLFESASFFLYNIILADYLRNLDSVKYYISRTDVRRAYADFSMARRITFIEEMINIAQKTQGEDLFVPQLASCGQIVPSLRRLQHDFRNQFSHTASANERKQRHLLEEFFPDVRLILDALMFFAREYRLVRIPSFYYKSGQLIQRIEVYKGVAPQIDEEAVSNEPETIKVDYDHLALLSSENRVLDLYPLYQLVASKETNDEAHICFLKQKKANVLEGESVQGTLPVHLNGVDVFTELEKKLVEQTPTKQVASKGT